MTQLGGEAAEGGWLAGARAVLSAALSRGGVHDETRRSQRSTVRSNASKSGVARTGLWTAPVEGLGRISSREESRGAVRISGAKPSRFE